MAYQLTAPRMGEGVEELTLVKWLKKEGDPVKELEPIVEVETDKVVTELPSPAGGVVLKILSAEGQPVRVGEILAWVGQPGEDFSAAPPPPKAAEKPPSQPVEEKPEKPAKPADRFLSPLVSKIAQENNVDLSHIKGSGKDGRITKNDVLAYLKAHGEGEPAAEYAPGAATASSAQPSPADLQPISGIRRTIAERMLVSLRTSAHVLTVMEADLSHVIAHRAENKPLFAQDGVRLTLTAYFITAIVEGLKANPLVNSSWTDEGLVVHPEINIGMAVSLGTEGLIVPVIRTADTLSLLGIARQVNDLADRARAKKLQPDEVRGGTFSLTNHGLGGSLFATPIISQPQVGILGTGALRKRVMVVSDGQGQDSIAIRPMIYLSFVFDHRVLDGESADRFLSRVKSALEDWK
jgi:2-oxoglutarate dehydrogenase E2 component (dihydrolipoamide succinyltransferase)